ncbi:hypothetical protein AB0B15_39680 [Streptomyces sp. NPDC045456]|uniref:hypothetical protein n=1 Tax=Streptomyces sp. NPDC045456 TaxID=3155254 RepID=UPI0033FBD63A
MSEWVTAVVSGFTGLAVGVAGSAVQVWKVKRGWAASEAERKVHDGHLIGDIRATGQMWIEYLQYTCMSVAGGQPIDLQTFNEKAEELRLATYRAMAKVPPSATGDFFYDHFARHMRELEMQVWRAVKMNDPDLASQMFGQSVDSFRLAQQMRQSATRALFREIADGSLNLGSRGGASSGGE